MECSRSEALCYETPSKKKSWAVEVCRPRNLPRFEFLRITPTPSLHFQNISSLFFRLIEGIGVFQIL